VKSIQPMSLINGLFLPVAETAFRDYLSVCEDLTEVRQAKVVSSMIAICYDFCPSIFGTTSLSFNR